MDSTDPNKAAFAKAELILKYLRAELEPGDEAKLNAWLEEDSRNRSFLESLSNDTSLEECLHFISTVNVPAALDKVLLQIRAQSGQETRSRPGILRPLRSWSIVRPWRIAAAVFVLLAGLTLLWRHYGVSSLAEPATPIASQKADVLPGSNKATLLLADGSVIALEDTGSEMVKEGNGVRIRQQDGEVIYEITGKTAAASPGTWNTISTPRGGQYRLQLPDGSEVWLNAGSDLRFPAVFDGTQRVVELTGEAYFEVAHKENQPFLVKTNGLTVEVLGTHFNVKAYADEQVIQTTLVEGSVKVRTRAGERLLLPGKQAKLDRGKEELQVRNADTEDIIAWKNGLFRFTDASVEEVMKKIGRWYNVEVIYGNTHPETQFTGMISRHVPLSQVLEMLEMTGGARFQMNGRSVTVLQ